MPVVVSFFRDQKNMAPLRYLACELASLNVKMEVKLTDRAREVSIHGNMAAC